MRTRRRKKTKTWEWRERKWNTEARREQDHRAGAKVDLKHLRARKPGDHQPQLACFRDTKTLGEVL